MKLYRVQFDDGLGPWHTRQAGVFVYPDYDADHGNYQPSPRDDGICDGIERLTEHCACSSLEQLRTWFAHCWANIKEAGGYVVELECDSEYVRHGTWQVCYKWEHAKEIRHFDLENAT